MTMNKERNGKGERKKMETVETMGQKIKRLEFLSDRVIDDIDEISKLRGWPHRKILEKLLETMPSHFEKT